MSYELKMQGVGNGKRSRLYKKTKRASMNKIDATHLPMRVQSDKDGYWSQTSIGSVHIPYSKIRKFLMARVGRPVDKVYSEFLQAKVVGYGSHYAVIVWKSSTYKNWSINDYYYYVVKISDIEAYKKEKYKL